MTVSAIYRGTVVHARVRPVRHKLRYRMLNLLLDLDELPGLGRRLALFGHNGRGLFSFHDADHGDGSAAPLRVQVEARLREAGLDPTGGRIRVLCMPRVLGMVFNPISVFFCHGADGGVQAMLYEVNNTFGQRHTYLIAVEGEAGGTIRQRCDKGFFVSPFMDMGLSYSFRVTVPDEAVSLAIDARDKDGPLLFAAFTGRRRALGDAQLFAAFLSNAFLAGRVMGGIHWEALKLWMKGLRLRPRPAPPAEAVTIHSQGHRT